MKKENIFAVLFIAVIALFCAFFIIALSNVQPSQVEAKHQFLEAIGWLFFGCLLSLICVVGIESGEE
jgi:hypothetical protein